ncbi:MAG: carboxymuconolactone decarboxylase family protein [Acidobacteria bacterium]|nr:carboxymuconolactone decarboxylase family protein [Acidobacteriota bacterium]
MAWIKVIDEEQADDKLREAYDQVSKARGSVANILKIHSLHPKVMTSHLALYRELMFGPSELTRAEREMIAVSVSVANHCHY